MSTKDEPPRYRRDPFVRFVLSTERELFATAWPEWLAKHSKPWEPDEPPPPRAEASRFNPWVKRPNEFVGKVILTKTYLENREALLAAAARVAQPGEVVHVSTLGRSIGLEPSVSHSCVNALRKAKRWPYASPGRGCGGSRHE